MFLYKGFQFDKIFLDVSRKEEGVKLWDFWKKIIDVFKDFQLVQFVLVGKYIFYMDFYLLVVKVFEYVFMYFKCKFNLINVDFEYLEEVMFKKDLFKYKDVWVVLESVQGVCIFFNFG